MKASTLTVRIDEKLKENALKACEYMGTTLSAVVTHALRSEIDRYYKLRLDDSKAAKQMAESENHDLMLNAAMREAEILHQMGFTKFLDLNKPQKLQFYEMYYRHLRYLMSTRPELLFEHIEFNRSAEFGSE